MAKNYDPFQHTAARRRLHESDHLPYDALEVSTHSRAEAAAVIKDGTALRKVVSTHSRAEAAANFKCCIIKT